MTPEQRLAIRTIFRRIVAAPIFDSYAKAYANAGLTYPIFADSAPECDYALKVQLLYVRSNLSGARGPLATEVRRAIDTLQKELKG